MPSIDKLDLSFLEQIRMWAESPRGLDADLVGDVAAEHAEVVVVVNDRLTEIGRLLNQGYRSEALQAAEQPPNILDLVAQLDFPELETWNEILLNLDIQPAPLLKLNIAAEIDNAYHELSGLERLLTIHRLLALNKSPLAQRIHVLRKIAKRDSLNPVWQQDLETWERARLSQIDDEIKRLLEQSDRGGLQALVEELSAKWTIELVENHRRKAQTAFESVQAQWAQREMKNVAKSLNQALAEFDVSGGRLGRSRWDELVPLAQLPDRHPILEQAREALAWLAEEDEHEAGELDFALAVARLEQCLDKQVTLKELNRCIYEVQKFQRELDPALAQRAVRIRRSLEDMSRRRNLMWVAASLLLIGLTITITAWLINARIRSGEIQQTLAQLTTFQANEEYVAAERFFSNLPPHVAADGQVVEIWSQLSRSAADEQSRQRRFRSMMDEAASSGVDEPRRDLVDQARSLAKTEFEAEEVRLFERQLEMRQSELQSQRGQQLQSELSLITRQLSELERPAVTDASRESLEKLRNQLVDLQQEYSGSSYGRSHVSLLALQQIEPILKRIDGHFKRLNELKIARQRLDEVTSAIGNWDLFARMLQQAAEAAMLPSQKTELELTLREANLWQAYHQWQQLAKNFQWDQLSEISIEDSQQFLSRIDELKRTAPMLWLNDSIKPAAQVLQKRAAVDSDAAQQAIGNLRTFFSAREHANLFMVLEREPDKPDLRYYCELAPQERESDFVFNYIKDIRMTETERKVIGKIRDRVKYWAAAPHTRIAHFMIEQIDEQQELTDRIALDWLERVLQKRASGDDIDPDPIVQVIMLGKIADEAAKISPLMNDVLQRLRDDIADTFAPRTDWIDPQNAEAQVRRQDCKQFLSRYRERPDQFRERWNRLRRDIDQLAQWREATNYVWIGWLSRDELGEWAVKSKEELEDNADLFVLFPKAGGANTINMERIGTYAAGNLLESQVSRMQLGRPVFSRPRNINPDPNP